MDLVDVRSVTTPGTRRELADWRPGDAVLAGGTFLFSEPQPSVRRLVDVTGLGWAPLVVDDDGLEIAATCTLATLAAAAGDPAPLLRGSARRVAPAYAFPPGWTLGAVVRQAVDALVASFKIWHLATVGGNVCLGLPAGAMTSLLSGLGGTATVWRRDLSTYEVPVADLVIGEAETLLSPGDVVRSFRVPISALTAPVAFGRASLSSRGRSASVVVARSATDESTGRDVAIITVTAATPRPYAVVLPARVAADDWHAALDHAIGASTWLDDVHGAADWRRAQTHRLGLEVLAGIGVLRWPSR
ncbi:FAD-binding molybdopterin dehydrogenase [Mumia zhuanghuii]|uniref:FAD binding domain-containing protein n=2 Tax=Mumia TaxID=1546255 RepID=A0ABW1QPG3_9ACTN|nr:MULTISPECIES: FAD binding domain-containing protein [Mumia]KAA1422259.1 FAD-binding molybdopterin dehydrogenase [Mumia zhuanghuii]